MCSVIKPYSNEVNANEINVSSPKSGDCRKLKLAKIIVWSPQPSDLGKLTKENKLSKRKVRIKGRN